MKSAEMTIQPENAYHDGGTSPPQVQNLDKAEVKAHAGSRPYETRLRGLTRSGDGYKTHCPFHADRSPSLALRQQREGRVFKCHGASCALGGGVR